MENSDLYRTNIDLSNRFICSEQMFDTLTVWGGG
nr:MAG TPA: hypothetical protein [Bacteriophage sp.]